MRLQYLYLNHTGKWLVLGTYGPFQRMHTDKSRAACSRRVFIDLMTDRAVTGV